MGHGETYLLLLPEGEETDTRHFDDLETYTGNITLGLATTTETRDKNLIVLIDEVKATIVLKHKSVSAVPVTGAPHVSGP